jgi:hypothetical protein
MNSKKILIYLGIIVVILLVFSVIGKKKGWFNWGKKKDSDTENLSQLKESKEGKELKGKGKKKGWFNWFKKDKADDVEEEVESSQD